MDVQELRLENPKQALKEAKYGLQNKEMPLTKEQKEVLEQTPVVYDSLVQVPKLEPISKEYFDELLKGKRINRAVRDRAFDFLNQTIENSDPSLGTHFRDTCIDITDTLFKTGSRISLEDYYRAALFSTYKAAGDTQITAYSKTFPDRVMDMERRGVPMTYLHSYAQAYASSKAVVEVQAKLLVPTHIMYHDYFHKAMQVTVEIMMDDNVSPKVRVEAANNVMNHTKQPEIQKAELDIKVQDTDAISQLQNALQDLSRQQRDLIIEGEATVVDVTAQEIYKNEEEEDE